MTGAIIVGLLFALWLGIAGYAGHLARETAKWSLLAVLCLMGAGYWL